MNALAKIPKLNIDPFERLALAVVFQAVLDSRRGDKDALRWLSVDGPTYLEAFGIESHMLYDFVERMADIRPERRFRANGKIVIQLGLAI